jgi:hypothetical protein
MSKFDATQADAIKRDNRAMEALGTDSSMVTLLEDIFNSIVNGAIGITARAGDIDALALPAKDPVTGAVSGEAYLFGQDSATTTGLTFGYKAGKFNNGDTIVTVAAGTLLLSASLTNYIEVDRAGTVSSNTSGFTAGRFRLYQVVTGGAAITSVVNAKCVFVLLGDAGVTGKQLSTMAATKATGKNLGDLSATASFRVRLPSNVGTITKISFTPGTTVTANDTDYWTFGVINKGAAGSGTTVIVDATAAANSTKATGGSGTTANVKRDLTLTGTGADLIFAAGDVLLITITKAASATAMAGCDLQIDSTFTG